MPPRFGAITENERPEIFAWILQDEFQNVNDAFSTKRDGKTLALASRSVFDSISGDEIGKYVFTLFVNAEERRSELLDVDIVLKNAIPARLKFEKKLPQSSDSNEYYEVVTGDLERHLVVETVNRYAVAEDIEGTERDVFVSAFPFELTIFESTEDLDKLLGLDRPIRVGNTDLTVGGLSDTFAGPGNLFSENEDSEPWPFMVGEILSFREITISFGSVKRDAYLVTLRSALGELPTLVGKEMFDTRAIGVGKIIGMNAYIKANLIEGNYSR